MPNWKVTEGVKTEIQRRAAVLLKRRIDMAQTGFPLTHDEVQLGLMDQDTIDRIEYLDKNKLAAISRFHTALLHLAAPDVAVGRTTVVAVSGGGAYWLSKSPEGLNTEGGYRRTLSTIPGNRPPVMQLSHLSPDKVKALTKWTNNVVRELRTAEVTQYVVGTMVERHLNTAAHIVARWPMVTALVEDREWRRRLEHTPKHMKQYGWDKVHPPGMPGPYMKLMQVAETAILGAEMMPDQTKERDMVASVVQWQPLPDDWKPGKLFPVDKT